MVAHRCRCQPCAGEKGGSETGPSPVDRGRLGSKHHLIVDANGLPLAVSVTAGNRHDNTQLIPLLDRLSAGRIETLYADRAYDGKQRRAELARRGIQVRIPGRHDEHGSGLGRHRWVVERTFAWLHSRRRLLVRTDRRHEIHQAFLELACALICLRRLEPSF